MVNMRCKIRRFILARDGERDFLARIKKEVYKTEKLLDMLIDIMAGGDYRGVTVRTCGLAMVSVPPRERELLWLRLRLPRTKEATLERELRIELREKEPGGRKR